MGRLKNIIENDDIEAFKQAVINGEDINQIFDIGCTPLILAADSRAYNIIEWLLQQENINVNLQIEEGYTAFLIAVARNDEKTISLFLEQKSTDINLENHVGSTPLFLAIENNNEKVVDMLLNDERIYLDYRDSRGDTALHLACHIMNVAIFSKLLQHMRNHNILNNEKNSPAFILLYKLSGFLEGNDIEQLAVCKDMIDALYQYNDIEFIGSLKQLLTYNDSLSTNFELSSSSEQGIITILHMLVDYFPHLRQLILQFAIQFYCSNIVNEIVSNYAQDIMPDQLLVFPESVKTSNFFLEGIPALHFAVITKDIRLLQSLLTLPLIDVNIEDIMGFTAYDIAAQELADESIRAEVCGLLEAHGANTSIRYLPSYPELQEDSPQQIPENNIHFIWVGGKKLRPQYLRNIVSIKLAFPEYKVILWVDKLITINDMLTPGFDFDDFDDDIENKYSQSHSFIDMQHHISQWLKTGKMEIKHINTLLNDASVCYQRLLPYMAKNSLGLANHTLRADILRTEILRQHGGIYIDADIHVVKTFSEDKELPFKKCASQQLFSPKKGFAVLGLSAYDEHSGQYNIGGLNNCIMVAIKNHGILNVIQRVILNNFVRASETPAKGISTEVTISPYHAHFFSNDADEKTIVCDSGYVKSIFDVCRSVHLELTDFHQHYQHDKIKIVNRKNFAIGLSGPSVMRNIVDLISLYQNLQKQEFLITFFAKVNSELDIVYVDSQTQLIVAYANECSRGVGHKSYSQDDIDIGQSHIRQLVLSEGGVSEIEEDDVMRHALPDKQTDEHEDELEVEQLQQVS